MKPELHYDKDTEVAYVDVCLDIPENVRIDVIDVTEQLGLRTQVLARLDDSGNLLGLIIQDYPAFKRELRRKYLALAVEKILDLIICKVKDLTSISTGCPESHRLHAAHA